MSWADLVSTWRRKHVEAEATLAMGHSCQSGAEVRLPPLWPPSLSCSPASSLSASNDSSRSAAPPARCCDGGCELDWLGAGQSAATAVAGNFSAATFRCCFRRAFFLAEAPFFAALLHELSS